MSFAHQAYHPYPTYLPYHPPQTPQDLPKVLLPLLKSLKQARGCYHCRHTPSSPGWMKHNAHDCPGDKANSITPAPLCTVTAVLGENESGEDENLWQQFFLHVFWVTAVFWKVMMKTTNVAMNTDTFIFFLCPLYPFPLIYATFLVLSF
jgi:hypothetical protein